jgi:two-component system, cell cycle response regulator
VKILVVEDNRLTRRMLQRYLEELGYEVLGAADGPEALELVARHRVRLVLTDWEMPGMSGIELVRRIRDGHDGAYKYLVFLTAREGKADLVAGIGAGADDYIRKPFDKDELAVRVRAGQRIIELQERLETQAETDPLTGAWNRRGLDRWFEDPDGAAALTTGPLAFVMVDLDHFKAVNDRYGHAVGDLALRVVAQRLQEGFPEGTRVARLGGEEFVAVFPAADVQAALASAEAVRRSLQDEPLRMASAGLEVPVTGSFGVCLGRPGALTRGDLGDALRRADGALYRSKSHGRNRATPAP